MTGQISRYFKLADLYVHLIFKEDRDYGMQLIPSFEPFVTSVPPKGVTVALQLTVDNSLRPVAQENRKRVRAFDTGNGDTIVDMVKGGGYQFIVKNIREEECSLLVANSDFSNCHCALRGNYNMRSFGLNSILMMAFAFAASYHNALLIHASLVRQNGWGYPFIAKSGTGKSTQVSLWLRFLPGCDLMNDDNPIIRVIDGIPYIYGSPWSGKTPCYRNVKARLGAIVRIDRAPKNSIEKLSPMEGFASALPSCSSMKWDSVIFNNNCNTLTKVIETTNTYILHCLPNREAAELCNKTIRRDKE
ncbi:MAG: hypothetical protein ACOYJF_00405 [Prevotella sp.]|jgi:hypothetical protein